MRYQLIISLVYIAGFTHIVFALSLAAKDILYDVPVSNHGARIRLIARLKNIELEVSV